jgi:hypothetical protein
MAFARILLGHMSFDRRGLNGTSGASKIHSTGSFSWFYRTNLPALSETNIGAKK